MDARGGKEDCPHSPMSWCVYSSDSLSCGCDKSHGNLRKEGVTLAQGQGPGHHGEEGLVSGQEAPARVCAVRERRALNVGAQRTFDFIFSPGVSPFYGSTLINLT